MHSCEPAPAPAGQTRWYPTAGVLAAAILLHILLAVSFWRAVPLFDWPDEMAHFNNARHLAETGQIDVLDAPAWDPMWLEEIKHLHFQVAGLMAHPELLKIRYQANHSPLYYVAAAGAWRLTGSPLAMKGVSLLFSCATLVFTFLIARRVFGDRWVPVAAAVLFLALHPMRAYMAMAINDDAGGECLLALGMWLILARRPAWMVGLAAGLGVLTEVQVGAVVPLYALWAVLDPQRAPTWRARLFSLRLVRDVLTVGGICLALASPWILHNIHFYGWGDPLGMKAHIRDYVQVYIEAGHHFPPLDWTGPYGLASYFRILFISWWGVYGWMSMWPPAHMVALALALSLVPVVGALFAAVRWWRTGPAARRALSDSARMGWWLAAIPMGYLGLLLRHTANNFQAQGRYLLIAGPVWGVLFAMGWFALPRGWRIPAAVVSLAAMAWLGAVAVHSIIPWYLAHLPE